jgi:hypothetical protein
MNIRLPKNIDRWLCYLLLAGILLIAGYYRFHEIGKEDLWLDEIATTRRAQTPLILRTFITMDAAGVSHFIYDFVIMKAWSVYGMDAGHLRSFSAFVSLLAVFLMYRVARLYFNRRTALMASFFMACSSYMVYYAQEARAYSLQVFLLLLMVFFFEKALRDSRKRDWILFSLFTILGIYTQVFTVFSWVTLNLYAFLRMRINKEEIPLYPWLKSQIWISLLILPYFVYLMIPDARGTLDWIPRPDFPMVKTAFSYYILGMANHLIPIDWKKEAYWFIFLLSGFCLAEVKTWKPFPKLSFIKETGILFCWLMFLVPLVLFILVSQVKPIFLPNRYVIISLPFFYLLWAVGIDRLKFPPVQLAAFLMASLILFTGLKMHFEWPYKIKWSEMAKIIHQERKPYDQVWVLPHLWEDGIEYYLPDPIPIKPIDANLGTLPVPNEAGRIWFIKVTSSSKMNTYELEHYLNSNYTGATCYSNCCPVNVEMILFTPRAINEAKLSKQQESR